MFRFANPEYFYLLIIVPVIALIYFATSIRAKRRLRDFGDPTLLKSLVPNYSRFRPLAKFTLLEVVITLMVFMLARPQYGTRVVEEQQSGIEVSIMMDVSNSMYANDINPNRIERSKLIVSRLIDELKNDKLALGIFAGEAYPQLPMTNDYVSAKMFLETISPDMVSYQGTNFASAINLAQHSFTQNEKVGKAIIIITDGENHEEGALEAAEAAGKAGLHLYILGIGSTSGSAIPLSGGGVMTDENGQKVITALNEQVCKDLAKAANGIYIHVDETDSAQKTILSALNKLQKEENTSQFTEADEQFRALAILIIFILIIEFFMFETENPLFRNVKLFKK